jgi:Ni/Fe-hydrogenase subunit HybB-like protein
MVVRVAGRAFVADPRLAWQAVRLEVEGTPRALKAWLGFLGVLVLVGALGALRSIFPGDKGTATTPTFEWGLLIVGYVFFAVTTSGLCLASSLGTVFGIERFRPLEKRHAVLAVLCLVTAFGVIALDLHYPVRMVFGAAFNPSPSSPMWWMGVFYGIYLCFLLVEVWSMFWHHPRVHGMACVLSSVMAIIAPTTLGAVFAVVSARSFWAGPFTPLLMLSTAFLSGTALLGVVFGVVDRLELIGFERAGRLAIPAIRSLLTIALVVVAVLVAREVVVGLTSTDPGLRASTTALVSGPLAIPFVGIRIVAGLVLPLALLIAPFSRTAIGLLVAGCLTIVGVFADRLTFVSAGQIAPVTATSGVVSTPYASYTPSFVEVSILVGAAALIALVYTLAERYLDLRESDVHIGFALPRQLVAWRRGRFARMAGEPVVEPVPGAPGVPAAPPAEAAAPAELAVAAEAAAPADLGPEAEP